MSLQFCYGEGSVKYVSLSGLPGGRVHVVKIRNIGAGVAQLVFVDSKGDELPIPTGVGMIEQRLDSPTFVACKVRGDNSYVIQWMGTYELRDGSRNVLMRIANPIAQRLSCPDHVVMQEMALNASAALVNI